MYLSGVQLHTLNDFQLKKNVSLRLFSLADKSHQDNSTGHINQGNMTIGSNKK